MRAINEDDVCKLVEEITNDAIENGQHKSTIQKRIICGLSFLKTVEDIPAIGIWVSTEKWMINRCSECSAELGTVLAAKYRYCPYCGARMRNGGGQR